MIDLPMGFTDSSGGLCWSIWEALWKGGNSDGPCRKGVGRRDAGLCRQEVALGRQECRADIGIGRHFQEVRC